jgi:hypothetical protein
MSHKSESIFLSISPPISKIRIGFEDSQSSLTCPSDKSGIKISIGGMILTGEN